MRGPLIFLLLVIGTGCDHKITPFSVSQVDRSVRASRYLIASNPSLVGTYPGPAKSGAGYFYDEVLEYRVWLQPKRGARSLAADNEDYFAAFATFEAAVEFSKRERGAEEPLVLIRQVESVNEPQPGVFEWDKTPRVTEWKPEWLAGSKRRPNSIPEFLKKHSTPATSAPNSTLQPTPCRLSPCHAKCLSAILPCEARRG
ncbi:MAG TPA: GCN5 family acetyltransferase [Thermoanaerobaculia bacterium]|nr:GCN5 family acetyltransferase [Thermoanaerobaculia bacterium]